ncbi:hypothetical protein OF122_04560 [Pelagibacterium flavum]|uniref:Uncharacterized protein n=1 Tax=Pelagibacterium flavum TaxID=2984530 RepID=A0ABY6IR10_9HYPH|nr:hypothetical protein [Pelagibacterium sp. YIM 151497]UYQ73041.1 hypothetical protein OF122_04560 [Pelagibacterium sp. YIM 151497]
MHPEIVKQTIERIAALEATTVIADPLSGLLRVNDEFTVSIVIVRCSTTPAGSLRWKIRFDRGRDPDITVAVRMNHDNHSIRDYLIVPTAEITDDVVRTAEANGIAIDAYLFNTLDSLFSLAERAKLSEAMSWT